MSGYPSYRPVPKSQRCRRCQQPVKWDDQRRQFARLMQNGLTKDQVKAVLPRCQKCTTLWLHPDTEGARLRRRRSVKSVK
jgi:hypothetical protein